MPASKCAKIGYLVVLSFQNVLHTLAMRYSRAEYRIRYSVSSVVILSEIVKFSISSLVLFHEGLFKRALSGIYYDTYDFLRTCVPALIYVVQNNIIIFALSCLDATVFQVISFLQSERSGDISAKTPYDYNILGFVFAQEY